MLTLSNSKLWSLMMDAFTFGMFGELETYEDRREYEEWLDSLDEEE